MKSPTLRQEINVLQLSMVNQKVDIEISNSSSRVPHEIEQRARAIVSPPPTQGVEMQQ